MKRLLLALALVACASPAWATTSCPNCIVAVPTVSSITSGDWTAYRNGTITALGLTSTGDGRGGNFSPVSSCTLTTGVCVQDTAGNYWQKFNTQGFAITVGDNTGWSGDIGAQINAAYAALPANGGEIVVVPPASGSCYNYTTPIVFNTSGKYPILEGAPASSGGVCLNYTPTTATAALTLDYVPVSGVSQGGHGLRNIWLVNNGCNTLGGCGSSAVGILVTTTNGGNEDSQNFGVTVQGFGIAYKNLTPTISVGTDWFGTTFLENTVVLQMTTTEKFHGGSFVANGKNFLATGTVPCELYLWGINTYDNSGSPNWDFTGLTNSANFSCTDCHFENTPSSAAYYFGGNVNVRLMGGIMEDDNSTGTGAKMMDQNGSWLLIEGTIFQSARPYTTIFAGAARGQRSDIRPVNNSPSNITTWVNGTAANWATICPIVALGSSNNPQICTTESSFQFAGNAPVLTGTCTTASQIGGTVAGSFTATCSSQTVIITFPYSAVHGWVCAAQDETHSTDLLPQTSNATNSCTLTGTTGTTDTIVFTAFGY